MKSEELPDIQKTKPNISIPIQQVGVQNVKMPIRLAKYDRGVLNDLIANVSMGTDLSPEYKGISMSRLIRTMQDYLAFPLKKNTLKEILYAFKEELECDSVNSYIKFEFDYPINIKSPKSDYIFPQYYKCSFEGKLLNDSFRFFEKVRVQYASYCPCSSSLCDDLRENGLNGFPHAQRCFADVMIEVLENDIVWLEEIIDLIGMSVKNTPYPILKRIDERECAAKAFSSPMFVEDAIREISFYLRMHPKIFDWIVKCTHQESIHQSDAVAINWKGIKDGFDMKYHL